MTQSSTRGGPPAHLQDMPMQSAPVLPWYAHDIDGSYNHSSEAGCSSHRLGSMCSSFAHSKGVGGGGVKARQGDQSTRISRRCCGWGCIPGVGVLQPLQRSTYQAQGLAGPCSMAGRLISPGRQLANSPSIDTMHLQRPAGAVRGRCEPCGLPVGLSNSPTPPF